jgi:hypothetical protein
MKGFTPQSFGGFFEIFLRKMEKMRFSPNHLFRVDENLSQLSSIKAAGLKL